MKVLTAEQKQHFDQQGYLVVEDVLDVAADIQPILDEYAAVLDSVARQLKAAGAIRSTYSELPFEKRLLVLGLESGRTFGQEFDFSLPQGGVKRDTPIHTGLAIFRMLTHPHLLDLVEDLIGPEIYSNPVQHVRMKLPARAVPSGFTSYLTTRVPWHQDNGVIMPEADAATILTVWMPMSAATLENGCMRVLPGSHRRGLSQHCPTNDGIAIPDQLVPEEQAVNLPMKPGSALLMTQRTMHSSLDNQTDDQVRISMDLRYQPIGQPTGRPAFDPAGFVARGARRPESVLRDPNAWTQNWHALRETLIDAAPTFNRWKHGVDGCA